MSYPRDGREALPQAWVNVACAADEHPRNTCRCFQLRSGIWLATFLRVGSPTAVQSGTRLPRAVVEFSGTIPIRKSVQCRKVVMPQATCRGSGFRRKISKRGEAPGVSLEAFKTILRWGRSSKSVAAVSRAMEYFLQHLLSSAVRDSIAGIFLYGSCARGEIDDRSDVDLLILCVDCLRKAREACADATFDVAPKYRKSVGPLVYCLDDFHSAEETFAWRWMGPIILANFAVRGYCC